MKVCFYLRVSTTDQDVESQRLALRRMADAKGWDVVAEFVDEGVSGSKTSRPGLDKMLVAAKARKFDAIAMFKLDRLGRSLSHLIQLVDQFREWGIGLVCLNESIDTTTAAGTMFFHMIGAFAQYERSVIRERTLAGLARARSQGRVGGRRFISQERADKIAAMLRDRRTVKQICAALSCGPGTVKRIRNDMASKT